MTSTECEQVLAPSLKNFPFPDYSTFKQELGKTGRIRLSVDRAVALQWCTRRGIRAPKRAQMVVSFWTFAPYLATLGYLGYIIATGLWWYLLALPVFVVAFFVYQPSSAMLLGPLRVAAVVGAFVTLAVSIIAHWRGVTAASLVLVTEWLSYKVVYRTSVDAFLRMVATNDDMFERCWNGGFVGIWLPDGTKYWSDRKYEAGQYVRYERE